MRRHGFGPLVTAHTLQDQAETVLTGPRFGRRGLGAMARSLGRGGCVPCGVPLDRLRASWRSAVSPSSMTEQSRCGFERVRTHDPVAPRGWQLQASLAARGARAPAGIDGVRAERELPRRLRGGILRTGRRLARKSASG
jgi:hypothetical protein